MHTPDFALTHDGTFTYTYNAAGRMVRAESVTSTLVYTYTSSGLRVVQAVGGNATSGGATTFAWDWASGLPEMLSEGGLAMGEPIALYLVGHDTLGQWDSAAWAYHLPDGLGSVRQVADGAGAVVSAREWTPYGVEVGGVQAGLGYTGEWWDAAVGLQYLRARWYAPYLNQFVSPDPIVPDYRNPQSINRYAYALGNPMSYIDSSGERPRPPWPPPVPPIFPEDLQESFCRCRPESPLCTHRGAVCDALPVSGWEPRFEPEKWNSAPKRTRNNCYSYAFNDWRNHQCGGGDDCYPEPGVASGKPFYGDAKGTEQYQYYTCQHVVQASRADAGGSFWPVLALVPCPWGFCKVALYIAPVGDPSDNLKPDFHWYRQDSNGCWSHKPALDEATQNDWPGQYGPPISDPRQSSKISPLWNPPEHYSEFCGFFCIPARQNGIPTEAKRLTGVQQ